MATKKTKAKPAKKTVKKTGRTVVKTKVAKTAPVRRLKKKATEPGELERIVTDPALPGPIPEEQPFGLPYAVHESEPPPLSGPGAWEAVNDDHDHMPDETRNRTTDDPHARWREWEERHARNSVRLYAIVGIAMAGIIGVWFLSLSDTVREIAAASGKAASIQGEFLDSFAGYESKLGSYGTGVATATPAVVAPVTSDVSPLAQKLKAKVEAASGD